MGISSTPYSQGVGPFKPDGISGDKSDSQAARQIGEMGDYPIGQVDVRTDVMKGLESAVYPLLMGILGNPQNVASQFGSLAGPVPGVPSSGLGSFLFGGSSGPAQGQQGQPVPPPGSPSPVDPHPPTPVPAPPPNPVTTLPTLPVPTAQVTPNDWMWQGANLTELNKLLTQGGYGGQVLNAKNVKRDQLGSAYADPEYWNGFRQSYSGPTFFSTLDDGKLDPSYSFANAQQLMNYFLDPQQYGGGGGDASQYNKKNSTGGKISEAEWKAWADAFSKFTGTKTNRAAQGGPLDPNAFTLVGEAGPELIPPMTGGQQQVVPLTAGNQQSMLQAPAGQGTGNFPSSPVQGQGTGSIQQLLQQNPEMDMFNASRNLLMGQGGMLGGGNAGEGVMQALQPVFRQNLQFGMNELRNAAPSVANTGFAIQGTDLTARALNDFNLMAAQAMQQGQQNTLGGLGLLGQLAGQAGGGAFGRNLQAGQLQTQRDLGLGSLGLQQQQQRFDQTVNPTLQLLLAAMGMATPTAYQTVVPGKK